MDPIMWDPFRYKLGGRLLNNKGEEFTQRYGVAEDGKYVITRDLGSYAILKEVEAGRGSPHGGVYLSFQHRSETDLRAAFGPVIDRLAANGIDLRKQDIEVAPIAHYHMGGIVADATMQTGVPGLYAAGEAVGGANGANRLSGNAITEALVFGREAGRSAATHAQRSRLADAADNATESSALISSGSGKEMNTASMLQRLQSVMQDEVGPLRDAQQLTRALAEIGELQSALGATPPGQADRFDMPRLDWFDLRNMLTVARVVAETALARQETRGAQQREDFPETAAEWAVNQIVTLRDGKLNVAREQVRARTPEPA
jgi:succinate dehydrogenase / fumarate reductase flavoprotein subunit